MDDREFIWYTGCTKKSCVFIPQLRMVVYQVKYADTRIFMRVVGDLQYVCSESRVGNIALSSWWNLALRVGIHTMLDDKRHPRCGDMLALHGPLIVNKIYRYCIDGIYTSASLDTREQVRLLTFTRTQDLLYDVTMRICTCAYLMMCNKSVLRVVELR